MEAKITIVVTEHEQKVLVEALRAHAKSLAEEAKGMEGGEGRTFLARRVYQQGIVERANTADKLADRISTSR